MLINIYRAVSDAMIRSPAAKRFPALLTEEQVDAYLEVRGRQAEAYTSEKRLPTMAQFPRRCLRNWIQSLYLLLNDKVRRVLFFPKHEETWSTGSG